MATKKPKPVPPPHVARAKLKGDTEALRAMGRIGGKKAALSKARQKFLAELHKELDELQKQLEEEFRQQEMYDKAVQANEHTHPVD